MYKVEKFVKRLGKIGTEVKLGWNIPWIYIEKINGECVTEKFLAEYGFTLAFLPVRKGRKLKFTDITEIFKLLRKYKKRSVQC